jgi:hypothetical protein
MDQLTEDIARRLRPVMPDLSEGEFTEFVVQMAALQDRYETRAKRDFFDRRTSGP